ncbi:hypothetical protein SAMN05518871_10720 [Psychrobacillus sp. OK028]|uniref:hypothetical protein n=1 Tax=Psychrobacillus sp. OK028 TaxID=1884359 RepID=UPI00088C918F|nr:hypothetical protein [Psychrobacillus sp. OK028]SDN70635.1 hypothetical protein SAMN05518871_10720 [Psychrobacillus sp. OK028]
MGKKIYIILSNTGTLFSKAIGMYTKKELNHASIAFDEELKEMYSFGRKSSHNPFNGGFVKENPVEGLFQRATCAIYECEVTDSEYVRMKRKIHQMEQQKQLYRYNLIGLLFIAINIEMERENAFFCSQFVATIMKECPSSQLQIAPPLAQPHHFEQQSALTLKFKGDLQTYVSSKRKVEQSFHVSSWKKYAFSKVSFM